MRTWADDFRTYDDACRYYGCDTPAQLRAEEEWDRQEAAVASQDDLEAYGGPLAAGQSAGRDYVSSCADRGVEVRESELVERVFPGYLRREPAAPFDHALHDDEIPF